MSKPRELHTMKTQERIAYLAASFVFTGFTMASAIAVNAIEQAYGAFAPSAFIPAALFCINAGLMGICLFKAGR